MLKHLQKFFNTASADNTKEAADMAIQETQTGMAAPNLVVNAEMQTLLETVTTTLAATQTKLAEVTAMYEAAQAALAAADEAKASLVADAAQKRLAARKSTIVAAIGTAKADAVLGATTNLDDASFEAVVGAMATSQEMEANAPGFKEVGVAVKTDMTKVVTEPEESEEAAILRKKYHKSK